jgi:predicted nucleotidyltransferase component of viral defense system
MLRITERTLRNWADLIGIDNLTLAEHDYRISYLLNDIYSNEFLKDRLLLKGGTAINKLYLKSLSRFSVDLDFNQIGSREEVLRNVRQIRETLVQIAKEQDQSYKITFDRRYEQTTIHVKYTSITGQQPIQPIKIEISHVERFPILKTESKELILYDSEESTAIGTYKIEELLATKLRALYDRMKGRDLYDLASSFRLIKGKTVLRKMFLYYFYRDRKVFNSKIFFEKVSGSSYEDDVRGFIKPDIRFNLEDAKKEVVRNYAFIRNLDDSDKQFLALAKFLLGDDIKKEMKEGVQSIEYPFRMLFSGVRDVNPDIFEIRTEDIRMYEK